MPFELVYQFSNSPVKFTPLSLATEPDKTGTGIVSEW